MHKRFFAPLSISWIALAASLSGCRLSNIIPGGGDYALAYTEVMDLSFGDGEFSSIAVESPQDDLELSTSSDGRIHISLSISAKTSDAVEAFKRQINQSQNGSDIALTLNNSPMYVCGLQEKADFNGKKERLVMGTCVHDVKIALPSNPRTRVIYNGVPAQGVEFLELSALPAAMKRLVHDSKKVALAQRYGQHYGQSLSMNEIAALSATVMSDSSKIEVILAFRSYSDPQNISAVLREFSFDSTKVEAIRAITHSSPAHSGRYISIAQLSQIVSSFSSDSSKVEALRVFSGHVSDPEHASALVESEFSFPSTQREALELLKK